MISKRYTYLGDRMTDPTLKGHLCTAVLREDGKTIRGRNGSMLVEFDNGRMATVIGRLLRKNFPDAGKIAEKRAKTAKSGSKIAKNVSA